MSYARFGWDNSSVYVFGTRNWENKDVLECCGCIRNPQSFYAYDEQEMIEHLEWHRSYGDVVPQSAIDMLIAERDGTPYADDEDFLDVMQRNAHMFGKTQEEMDQMITAARKEED